jgi:hypothetical protein
MSLGKDLEMLTRALFEENYSSSEVKNILSRIVNFPTRYSKEEFESWKKSLSGFPEMLKTLFAEPLATGRQRQYVKSFLGEISSNRDFPEKNKDQILKDLMSFVSSIHSKNSEMERQYKNENPGSVLENPSVRGPSSNFSSSKFIKDLVDMAKKGSVSRENIKKYVSENLNDRFSDMFREARSQGYPELIPLIIESARDKPKMADTVFGNVLDTFSYRLKVEKFKELYLSKGEIGHRQLYELIGNLRTVSSLTGLSLDEIKKEFQNKNLQRSFADFFADDLAGKNTLKSVLTSESLSKKIRENTRKVMGLVKDKGKKNANTSMHAREFTNEIMISVREELKSLHLENLKTIFGSKTETGVSEDFYKILENIATSFAMNELSLFRSHYEIREVKVGDRMVSVPVFYKIPGVYGSDADLAAIKMLADYDGSLDNKLDEESREKKARALEATDKATEERLRASMALYPSHFKIAQRLLNYHGYSNLRAAIRRDEFLGKRLNMQRINYLLQKRKNGEKLSDSEKKEIQAHKKAVDNVIEQNGTITLGKLFVAASKDIDRKRKDPFYHPRHLIALVSLSEMTGTTRSKWFFIVTQANEMLEMLGKDAKRLGTTLDKILERVDIQDIPSSSTRPAGKGDERSRKKWEDHGLFEFRNRQEYIRKLNSLKSRREVFEKYGGTHFDHRGRPKSPLYKEFFAVYEKMYETDPAFKKQVDNNGGIYVSFENFMNTSFIQGKLREDKAVELFKALESPEAKTLKRFMDSQFYFERYERGQKLFTYSPGEMRDKKWYPISMDRQVNASLTEASSSGDKVEINKSFEEKELMQQKEILEYVENKYKENAPIDEKFSGMTFLGRVEASSTIEELDANLAFIHSYIPESHLNEFQEGLGDGSISKVAQRRRQELQGLNNNPNVTPIV